MAVLFTLSPRFTVLGQQYVTQAERNLKELTLRNQIRGKASNIESTKKWIAEHEPRRERMERNYRKLDQADLIHLAWLKKTIAENLQKIRQWEREIENLEAQLRNLPPVRDEARERAQAERAERISRQAEQDRAHQEDVVRRQMRYFERADEKKRADYDRQLKAVESWGESLGREMRSAYDEMQKRYDDKIEKLDREIEEANNQIAATQAPVVIAPQAKERTRIIGGIENGEFIPTPGPPEPAKPLFDSLSGFLKEVGSETTQTLLSSFIDSAANGGQEDFRQSALDSKLEELKHSLGSVLPADSKAVYHMVRGDFKAAQEAMIELLPPERRLDARASQLPLSVVTGEYQSTLESIWDNEVTVKVGTARTTSQSQGNYDFLASVGMDLLSDERSSHDEVKSARESRVLEIKRDPELITAKVRGMTPDQARNHLKEERAYWEANKQRIWRSHVHWVESEYEADRIVQDYFRDFEQSMKNKERILKELDELTR